MDISHFKEKRIYTSEDIAPLLVFIKNLEQDKEKLSNELQIALEKINSPSIIALTRQKLNPIRKEFVKENKCSYGGYEVLRTKDEINLTIFASGSELNLAIEASHKLATENIYSKVISVPSQELLNEDVQMALKL